MDTNTGLMVLGAAIGSKELIQKILGPTADYLGAGLRDWTEKRVNNTARIFENANNKLPADVDPEGRVHPKVLKEILDDGSFHDDRLASEYFGGVLASSRLGVSRDDRGATFARLVTRLTTYQLRTHYLFYGAMKKLYEGNKLNIAHGNEARAISVYVPLHAFIIAMDLKPPEDLNSILTHIVFGLEREALIGDRFATGNSAHIKSQFSEANEPGILLQATAIGTELFMWAHGIGNLHVNEFLNPSIKFDLDLPEGFLENCIQVTKTESLENLTKDR